MLVCETVRLGSVRQVCRSVSKSLLLGRTIGQIGLYVCKSVGTNRWASISNDR